MWKRESLKKVLLTIGECIVSTTDAHTASEAVVTDKDGNVICAVYVVPACYVNAMKRAMENETDRHDKIARHKDN